jgi:ankyrin repeat protein
MGAAASVSHDLLLEEASKPYGHPLTKESLAELRRSSFSTFANPKAKNLTRIPTTIDEFPLHVVSLLKKIGIETEDGDVDTSAQLSSTTKLVAHIFECLGALRHLVRANQILLPGPDDETQSVTELGTKAVGKLVHEMISIYGLCGDTLRILLAASPESANVEDAFGRLPLHAAVDSDKPWLSAVENIIESYPEALLRRDGGGRLPLHVAVDKSEPNVQLVSALVTANPVAAGVRRGVGRLPIHYIMFCDKIPLGTLEALHAACPDGVKTRDAYERLPLHYAVDKTSPQVSVVKYLLDLYPDGASARDSHMRYPLTIAVDRDHADLATVRLLAEAFPNALTVPGLSNRLPLHVAVDAQSPSVQVVRFLMKKYPQAATYSCDGPNKGKVSGTPFDIVRHKKNLDLLRCMLLCLPHVDPVTLKDLNWKARRSAFLIVYRPPPSPLRSCQGSPDSPDSPRRLSHLQLSFRSVYAQGRTSPPPLPPLQQQTGGLDCFVLQRLTVSGVQNILASLFDSNDIIFRIVIAYL